MPTFGIPDKDIISSSTLQTASGQNVLLPTPGTGSVNKTGFRSVVIQINCTGTTITAGVITFEASNDDVSFFPLPLYDAASLTAAPVSNYTVALNTPRWFCGPCTWKYIRARISTTITGTGTFGVRAYTTLSPQSFSTDIMAIVQPTAANLNATVSGTVTANMGTGGTGATSLGKAVDAAAGATDTGVAMLAKRVDAPSTITPAVNDYAVPIMDSLGRFWVNNQFASVLNPGYTVVRILNLTNAAQALKASAGNIHGLTVINPNAVTMYIKFYNTVHSGVTVGTTTIVKILPVPAADAVNPGIIIIPRDETSWLHGSTALSCAAVTGSADNSTTQRPTADLIIEADIA